MQKQKCLLPLLAFFAALLLPATAREPGVRAQFVGGTVGSIPTRSKATIDITATDALRFRSSGTEIRIPYHKIQNIEYGQNVSRRYAAAILISPLLLLSKARRHFVTVGYLDSENRQQALVFRVEKGDIRFLLVSLEAGSGRRIEYQDDEARKAGRG